ncbi:MAG: DNA topoisomerase IV subunit A [Rhodothalassiaceae bacterium]
MADDKITDLAFVDALSERYLAYALSTIMSRSLPDVRDGLKPVHRRLLYAMRLLRLNPEAGFKKCARVVGDVIGKYHPHGDQSVYDALVRLAQDFAVRYPLIDGQGNFGNVDGDNPAAMRYTEARLTRVAILLMDGLDEDAVDFRETYDGEDREPVVLPGAFPNLLANGAAGIAVGMATSIPPHNAAELIDACQLLIDERLGRTDAVSVADLVERVQGPDFPTGGVLVEPRDSILSAYETGRGGFRTRASWSREDQGRGTWQIVVTEIPYGVAKSKLVEKIAELVLERKLPILGDVRDESAEDIRLVLEPKSRSVDPDLLMESLFKLTDLETRFPLNLNVIAGGRPQVLSLKGALNAFLDHRLDVLLRRSRHRLDKIAARLNVLDGYLIAFLNLDEVIRIIREEDEPKQELMAAFSLNDEQAEAILNMRLRSLRKLEEMELRAEHDRLTEEQQDLTALLDSPERQWERIGTDLADIKAEFGPDTELGRRRTRFGEAPTGAVDIPLEAMIEREPITVVCSTRGWLRALKGHLPAEETLKFKEGDAQHFRFHAYTTDKILAFTSAGRMHTLRADTLPGGRGAGEPITLMVEFEAEEELVALRPYRPGGRLLLAASDGRGFITEADKALAQTKAGKQLMSPGPGARASHCLDVDGDHVAVIGDNRKLLVFPVDEVPELARGRGVKLQSYKDGGLSDIMLIRLAEGLSWPMGGASGRIRTETDLTPWLGRRASAGRLAPRGFPQTNRFSGG